MHKELSSSLGNSKHVWILKVSKAGTKVYSTESAHQRSRSICITFLLAHLFIHELIKKVKEFLMAVR